MRNKDNAIGKRRDRFGAVFKSSISCVPIRKPIKIKERVGCQKIYKPAMRPSCPSCKPNLVPKRRGYRRIITEDPTTNIWLKGINANAKMVCCSRCIHQDPCLIRP
jgi:hypothetical protein